MNFTVLIGFTQQLMNPAASNLGDRKEIQLAVQSEGFL